MTKAWIPAFARMTWQDNSNYITFTLIFQSKHTILIAMSVITTTLFWYVMLFVLGSAAMPLTHKIFSGFFDRGYPLAKTVGILITSYLMLVLATTHILPFGRITVTLITLLLFIGGWFLTKNRTSGKKFTEKQLILFVFEEVLFLSCLLLWVWVRGQEPSLRGLEKFMDFGFINTALAGKYFPPADMWLAGHTINYYYFGHIVAAVLTKLSGIPSKETYNLILATIFALGITTTFSICFNLAYHAFEKKLSRAFSTGLLGAFIVNLTGNLHTIYTFTTGYANETPVPFWKIMSRFTPEKYWYPNATRFIPFTIHEFPMYSYVVADLHGHVFDIPFVLLTLALILAFFIMEKSTTHKARIFDALKFDRKRFPTITKLLTYVNLKTHHFYFAVGVGFMLAVHYMTNAFDAGVYLALAGFVLWYLVGLRQTIVMSTVIVVTFLLFSLPFSLNFAPFASGIGVNCAPLFLTNIGRVGPFLFEAGKCQLSPLWMLIVLWGFFWFNGLALTLSLIKRPETDSMSFQLSQLMLIIFGLSTLLILFPEAFYLKDIYPNHFRANTMFKLGYQAFMMMGIASTFTFVYIKRQLSKKPFFVIGYCLLFTPLFFLIAIYPYFAIKSYYGTLQKPPQLDGSTWIADVYPEYTEIINYLSNETPPGTIILEAQGDSYTDYNVVSSYSGRATVAGWWVHQWLWRGSSDVVGKLIPDITTIYESHDRALTKQLLIKHKITYVVIGTNERQKYKNLFEEKFGALGQEVFRSKNGQGHIYKIPLDSF